MNMLQEFQEISRNIVRELKQLLNKFCVNFVQEKYGQILIKTYPNFG